MWVISSARQKNEQRGEEEEKYRERERRERERKKQEGRKATGRHGLCPHSPSTQHPQFIRLFQVRYMSHSKHCTSNKRKPCNISAEYNTGKKMQPCSKKPPQLNKRPVLITTMKLEHNVKLRTSRTSKDRIQLDKVYADAVAIFRKIIEGCER